MEKGIFEVKKIEASSVYVAKNLALLFLH